MLKGVLVNYLLLLLIRLIGTVASGDEPESGYVGGMK